MTKYEEHFDETNNIGGWTLEETIAYHREMHENEEERFTDTISGVDTHQQVQQVSGRPEEEGDMARDSNPVYRVLP